MVKKAKKKLKLPAIMNSRFLLALLKVVMHGEIGVSKLTMIGTLMKMVDIGSYSKDIEIVSIYKSLEIALDCKIDDIKDNQLIMSLIETSIHNEDNTEIVSGLVEPIVLGIMKLQEKEISWTLTTVSTYSKAGFLLEYKDSIIDKLMNIETGSSYGVESVVDEFQKEIAELHMKLHKTLSSDSLSTTEPVSISDPEFMSKYFKKVYDMSKRSTKVLKTGIKKLNEMLSEEGGFLTGKMYTIYAPTNSFKTGLLLYIAKWIQQYNSDAYLEKFKENGKRPTIVVVSLENTWDENTERLFSMFSGCNMRDVKTFDEASNMWRTNVYRTNSIIDICMVYGKAGRFSPSDLEYRIDEIEAAGGHVIASILDYARIMRDDLSNPDPRVKAINIFTDLHEIVAVRPDMVMITAHHTNREGDKLLTDVADRGGVDKVKVLGRQHLTEAHGVEDAIDASIFINPEISPYTGESYLTFKKGKMRYKRTPLEYFAHKLVNRFFLTDDIDLEHSLSIESLAQTSQEHDGEAVYSNERAGSKGRVSARRIEEKPKNVIFFDSGEDENLAA